MLDTTVKGMIDPVMDELVMTRDEAQACFAMFTAIGGFSKVNYLQMGGDFAGPERGWIVELWSVNARAGNRNLEIVKHLPTEKEAKLIAKKAKGKANQRDTEALNRIASQREVDRE